MEKYKYRRTIMDPFDKSFDLDHVMDTLGADGWELVAVVPSTGREPHPVWIFKRPYTSEEYGSWTP